MTLMLMMGGWKLLIQAVHLINLITDSFSLTVTMCFTERGEEEMLIILPSEVCMISVLLYWPTPLALKAFTLDL